MEGPPLPVRPDLAGTPPYVSPQMPARYRLNTNESPYPPPPELLHEVTRRLEEIELNRYPDRDAGGLVAALAEASGWSSDGLWVANGSNEVLLHLFLAFGGPGRRCLTFEPTYALHSLIPRIAGTEGGSGTRGERWQVGPDEVSAAASDADIVIFCSPNNPTGALEERTAVLAALEVAPLVVVDEAYIDFAAPDSSIADLLPHHRNLIVTRTFSKGWSLAGVRLGYLLAAPEIVAAMQTVRLPYSLSSFTQLMGLAALRHADDGRARAAAIARERQRISAGLADLGVVAYPSQANFVLFETGDPKTPEPERTERLWRDLLDRGVLVRNYSSSPNLRGCLRVTAGLPEETEAFLAAMGEVW